MAALYDNPRALHSVQHQASSLFDQVPVMLSIRRHLGRGATKLRGIFSSRYPGSSVFLILHIGFPYFIFLQLGFLVSLYSYMLRDPLCPLRRAGWTP